MEFVNKASFALIALGACIGHASAGQAELKGSSWPIGFKQNAQTLPSIEIKLAPPEDPLPQVTAEVQLLERSRMKLEEGMMAKLEDAYNMQLDNAQVQILSAVDRAMQVFDSPDVLRGALKGALLPLKSKRKTLKGSFSKESAFSQTVGNVLPSFRQKENEKTRAHKNGPLAFNSSTIPSSFLQMKESSKLMGPLSDVISPPPSVKVQLTGIKEPDAKIKEKMEEIEQLRTDEETTMFEKAVSEFEQLTKITVQELEKNIQIQMNPFLVDSQAVATEVETQIPKRNVLQKMVQFREVENEGSKFLEKKCAELKEKYGDAKIQCGAQETEKEEKTPQTSFLEMGQKSQSKAGSKLLGSMEKQLNVRLAQSEHPYPTIDEIVHDMQKKRDATERLERMKILELQLKLLKAQDEMIKDALHTNLSRVIAQYGPAIEGIKAEVAVGELAK